MNNKNAKITMVIAVLAIIFMVGVGTYAFFAPQTGGSTSTNATVTSNTTDLLTFSINRDINFTVSQNDFQINGNNKSGDATATATLTPNNKTGAATMYYNLYLNIESNDLVYTTEKPGYYVNTEALVPFSDTSDPYYERKYYISNEYIRLLNNISGKIGSEEIGPYLRELFDNLGVEALKTSNGELLQIYNFISHDFVVFSFDDLPVWVEIDNETGDSRIRVDIIDENVIDYLISLGWFRKAGNPELVLQVFDNNNNLVEIDDMGIQITTKGVTGYDITAKEGLIPLLNNHAISATNNAATIENWRVVLTLINLDYNQNENTGKEVSAELIIQQEPMNMGLNGTIYRHSSNAVLNNKTIFAFEYPVYCEFVTIWDRCEEYIYWENLQDCEDYVSTYQPDDTCQYQVKSMPGIGQYETSVNAILSDYSEYLKHVVVNNIIQSTEVCLWYNNLEFCFGAEDYWDTRDEYFSEYTTQKLKNDIEESLGIDNVSCDTLLEEAKCYIGSMEVNVGSSNRFKIGECELMYDGSSKCEEEEGTSL